MSRVIETTVYEFDELSPEAQEAAREWYRGLIDSNDYDATLEDAARMGELLGIEFKTREVKLYGGGTRHDANIFWSGFCSQGDGASFEGTYTYKPGAVKALRAEAPASYERDGVRHENKQNMELHRIARELQEAQREQFYQIVTTVTQSGRYVHDGTMSFDHERKDEKECSEQAAAQIKEALRDFAKWIYRQLELQNEWLYSAECVDDNIRANDYEFTAEGVHHG